MLRELTKLIVQAHKAWDICLTGGAFIAAYFIKLYILPNTFHGLTTAPNYYIVLLMIIIVWYVTFTLFDLYKSYRQQSLAQILWNMVKAVSIGMLVMLLCMYIFKITDVSRIMMGIFFLLNIGLLAISKGMAYTVLIHYRQKGFNSRNVLIIGSRERAKDVIDTIGDYLGSGYRVVGCLELDGSEVDKEVKNGIQVIGTIDNLEKILRDQVVDELIFAMPLRKIENADKYMSLAEEIGVTVRIIPDWQIQQLRYRPGIASIQFEEFLGLRTLALTTTPVRYGELLIKSAFDYVSTGMVMVVLMPFFLLISCAIKLSSRGLVFFKQQRCGLNGRKFMIYKFRTMVADAEARRQELDALNETDGPVFKIKKDPRIIPFVGTLLRKTGLDEFPQLINILKGEMSLIGPRPPIPSEVEEYDVWQRRRLSMKPGITCIWQASPNRNEVGFDEWMKMDLSYIDNWSLGLDLKIMLGTAKTVLTGSGR
jgi:exopolysaccharide biosynthesis polyprenyl glycosylphosphotransferase